MSYMWYDNVARRHGISQRKVSTLVRKHDLPRRKIYGCLAVDSQAWDKLWESLHDTTVSPAPGTHKETHTMTPKKEDA